MASYGRHRWDSRLGDELTISHRANQKEPSWSAHFEPILILSNSLSRARERKPPSKRRTVTDIPNKAEDIVTTRAMAVAAKVTFWALSVRHTHRGVLRKIENRQPLIDDD